MNNDDVTVTMTTFSRSYQHIWVGSDQFTLTTLEEAKYWRNGHCYIGSTYIVVVIYVESLVCSNLNECSWMNFGGLFVLHSQTASSASLFLVDVTLNAKMEAGRGSGYTRLLDCWKWSMLFIKEILSMFEHQQAVFTIDTMQCVGTGWVHCDHWLWGGLAKCHCPGLIQGFSSVFVPWILWFLQDTIPESMDNFQQPTWHCRQVAVRLGNGQVELYKHRWCAKDGCNTLTLSHSGACPTPKEMFEFRAFWDHILCSL